MPCGNQTAGTGCGDQHLHVGLERAAKAVPAGRRQTHASRKSEQSKRKQQQESWDPRELSAVTLYLHKLSSSLF